ncbi:immunity 22 family protein [Aliikangiella sp. IMCC44653]
MSKKELQNAKGFDFTKSGKVSVWASQLPYASIPDEYFEERFSKNQTRANNQWSDNFKLRFFYPENMETNGAMEGMVEIENAVGECSFSSSFIANLMSKAKKLNLLQVTWVVLLYDFEFSAKLADINSDDTLTFVGAFNYDEEAESVIELPDEPQDDADDENSNQND